MAGQPPAQSAREVLALALDVPTAVQARAMATELAQWFSVVKVGLELFVAAGPQIVGDLRSDGFKVFADLKLHDIPNTVNRTARQLGQLGVAYATLHAAGGAEMLAAGVDGLHEGAATSSAGVRAAEPPPAALAVTVLTSVAAAGPAMAGPAMAGSAVADELALLGQRTLLAMNARCAGVICAAADIETVEAQSALFRPPPFLKVVPGVRPAGTATHDQARVTTPAAAIAAGADLLVIGRAVTDAVDPTAAALSISSEVTAALGERANTRGWSRVRD